MLKYILTVCLIAFSISTNIIQADLVENKNYNKPVCVWPQPFCKVYFSLDSVYTHNNQMYIEMDDILVPINEIFNDVTGSYYTFIEMDETQAGGAIRPRPPWPCPKCGRHNSPYECECVRCGWPNDEKKK